MSGDLVERLRTETNGDLGRLDAGSRWGTMIVEAAARIDELERALVDAKKRIDYLEGEIEDLVFEIRDLGSR